MYVALVSVTVKAESVDEFEKAVLKNAATSLRVEKDCRRFDVCQSENDPAEWLLYEVYSDRTAFDFHHEQPHFVEYNTLAQRVVTSRRVAAYQLKNPRGTQH